jgi:uncharacterized protein YjbI with pentapeptide repeats
MGPLNAGLPWSAVPEADSPTLRADCARCFALCCVAPAFSASTDFAIDKPAGTPCRNLGADFGCTIHDHLRQRGFPGCTVYDCFGAGQQVAQVTFGGRDWRAHPELAGRMFTVFPIVRQLHELLWYLSEARTLRPSDALRAASTETTRLAEGSPDELAALDVGAHRESVNVLLRQTSSAVRAGAGGAELRGADLMGRDLSGRDLRGANLRGAYLIGADLCGADLRLADLIGADLRGADLAGADLSTAIFLTQSQLDAATGDPRTALAASLTRPTHWPRR